MTLHLMLLVLACVRAKDALITYWDVEMSGCTESDKETLKENDGDEIVHADFKKQKLVISLPEFAGPMSVEGFYQYSVAAQAKCQKYRNEAITAYKNPPEEVDAPQSSIYTKDDVQLGSKNILICHVTGFFPPPVSVIWRKNNVDVTDSAVLSQFYPKKDGTYTQFSHLSFTPVEGDVYTCTVQHKSLPSPQIRTLEIDVEQPSVGPAVFCGVGLVVGLLGVATGTFFLIKGNNCN